MDRRFDRTERAIAKAFTGLLCTTSYASITTSEIIERAGSPYTQSIQSKANRSLTALAKYDLVRMAGTMPADRGNVAYLWEAVE